MLPRQLTDFDLIIIDEALSRAGFVLGLSRSKTRANADTSPLERDDGPRCHHAAGQRRTVRHLGCATGVRVKKSRFGFFGPILYNEKNVYLAAQTGIALTEQFPDWELPIKINDPVLSAFANAVWHCSTAAVVAITLGQAWQARGRQ